GDSVLSRALDHLEEWLIAILIAAATALIFVAVLHRYGTVAAIDLSKWANAHGFTVIAALLQNMFVLLSDIDLSWAQELCIYMFIWMAKFGAAYGVRTGIHVGVDVLVNLLSPSNRRRVILFSLLCGALFTGTVAVFGANFVIQIFQTGQVSNDLEAPMWFVYLAIPLGSGLMCFRFLQVAWFFARTGELPHHDPAHVEGVQTPPAAADGAIVEGVADPFHPVAPGPARKRNGAALGRVGRLAPILILPICLAQTTGIFVLPQGIRALIVFALLIALMLTGMPISIALGLTVLTFLFTLTEVPIESVALKLFT